MTKPVRRHHTTPCRFCHDESGGPPGRSLPHCRLRLERERGVRLRDGTLCGGGQQRSCAGGPKRPPPRRPRRRTPLRVGASESVSARPRNCVKNRDVARCVEAAWQVSPGPCQGNEIVPTAEPGSAGVMLLAKGGKPRGFGGSLPKPRTAFPIIPLGTPRRSSHRGHRSEPWWTTAPRGWSTTVESSRSRARLLGERVGMEMDEYWGLSVATRPQGADPSSE
jgi:hypothetical protein